MKFQTLFPVLMVGMMIITSVKAADNVHFTGALVAEPCTLPDIDTDIHVDFGTVIVKYLYQYRRTKNQTVMIHLENCEPSFMNSVSMKFNGVTDSELTTMLAVDQSSTTDGIAIGFEDSNGKVVNMNESTPLIPLKTGENILKFFSFVQIKPSAFTAKSLKAGNFSAIANFSLTYE